MEKEILYFKSNNKNRRRKQDSAYERNRKIRFRYNKEKKTLRAVLIDNKGRKVIVEKINVESVEKYPYKNKNF